MLETLHIFYIYILYTCIVNHITHMIHVYLKSHICYKLHIFTHIHVYIHIYSINEGDFESFLSTIKCKNNLVMSGW